MEDKTMLLPPRSLAPAPLAVPEREEPLRVVHRRHWLPLRVLAGIAVMALGYMLFGRIPITVEGNAMFLTPGTVVTFQSTASGQIAHWKVHVGDFVKKGDLLVQLEQPLTKKQLEQAEQKLADLVARNETLAKQDQVYVDLERESIALKKQTLEARIETLEVQIKEQRDSIGRVSRQKASVLTRRQRDLEAMKRLNEKREAEVREKLKLTEKLQEKGLRSEDQALIVQREKMAQDDRSSAVDLQRVQASLDGARAAETMLDAENRITEQELQKATLTQQLQELIAREAELGEQTQAATFSRDMEVNDVKRMIARLEEQLTEERDVRSEFDGRIVEIAVPEGQLASKGMTLGSIDTRAETSTLAAVAYFQMKDGKKIEPGMTIRIIPAIVEEARFGGVIGQVTQVSEYPVTAESLAKTIGNSQAAQELTKGGHFVEVHALLVEADTFSGYAWERFGGPDMKVTAGTIGKAYANTKEVRPLSFVIPILEDI